MGVCFVAHVWRRWVFIGGSQDTSFCYGNDLEYNLIFPEMSTCQITNFPIILGQFSFISMVYPMILRPKQHLVKAACFESFLDTPRFAWSRGASPDQIPNAATLQMLDQAWVRNPTKSAGVLKSWAPWAGAKHLTLFEFFWVVFAIIIDWFYSCKGPDVMRLADLRPARVCQTCQAVPLLSDASIVSARDKKEHVLTGWGILWAIAIGAIVCNYSCNREMSDYWYWVCFYTSIRWYDALLGNFRLPNFFQLSWE